MSSVWAGVTFGLFVGAATTRFYYYTEHRSESESRAPSHPRTCDHWTDVAEFAIKLIKLPITIASKSLERIKEESIDAPRRSWTSYLTDANALTVYALFAGTAYLTYGQTPWAALSDTSWPKRFQIVAGKIIESTQRITVCYKMIKFSNKFIRNPTHYAIPVIFASAMVAANCFGPRPTK